jgi:hypothetical protein
MFLRSVSLITLPFTKALKGSHRLLLTNKVMIDLRYFGGVRFSILFASGFHVLCLFVFVAGFGVFVSGGCFVGRFKESHVQFLSNSQAKPKTYISHQSNPTTPPTTSNYPLTTSNSYSSNTQFYSYSRASHIRT